MSENFKKVKRRILLNKDIPDVFYVWVKSRSRSGVSRTLRIFLRQQDVTEFIAYVLNISYKNKCVRVSGCGADMVSHILSRLYYELGIKEAHSLRAVQRYVLI